MINGMLKLDDVERLWTGNDPKNAADAARKLYACQGLKTIAGYIASRHPYALSYLRAAPAIACSPRLGAGKQPWQSQKTAANEKAAKVLWASIEQLVEKGAPLREVMDKAQIAYPLRKLSASALNRGKYAVIAGLNDLPPEVLGRAIPTSSAAQRVWLGLMGSWIGLWKARLAYCQPELTVERATWAAVQFGLAAEADGREARAGDVSTLVDFVARGERFNPAWSLKRAREEQSAWVKRMNLIHRAEGMKREHGIGPDDTIDETPLPEGVIFPHSVIFKPLRTAIEIINEGVEMDHCVAIYVPRVKVGHCHIVGIRNGDGDRLATLELNEWGRPVQLRGPHNARPSEAVIRAAIEYGEVTTGMIGLQRERTRGPAEVADRWLQAGPPRHFNARCATWPTVVAETDPIGLPGEGPRDIRIARVAPGEAIYPGDAIRIGEDGFAHTAGQNPDAMRIAPDVWNALQEPPADGEEF